jgi:hypothetical protein
MESEMLREYIDFCMAGNPDSTFRVLSGGFALINDKGLPERDRLVAGMAVIGLPLYGEVYEDVDFFESPLVGDDIAIYDAIRAMDRMAAQGSKDHFLQYQGEASLEEVLARAAGAIALAYTDPQASNLGYMTAIRQCLNPYQHTITVYQLDMAIKWISISASTPSS